MQMRCMAVFTAVVACALLTLSIALGAPATPSDAPSAPAASEQRDIRGPQEPVSCPLQCPLTGPCPLSIIVGVVLAGFALSLLLRGRTRKGPAAAPQVVTDAPFPDLNASSASFYASLMGVLRCRLAVEEGSAAHARTPREVAEALAARTGEAEKWSPMCRRAELALYAGAEIASEEREKDLAALSDAPQTRSGAHERG